MSIHLLGPIGFEPAKLYQQSLKETGIPWTSFAVDDLESEYKRLSSLGVEFSITPREAGTVMFAVLDDTCLGRLLLTYSSYSKRTKFKSIYRSHFI